MCAPGKLAMDLSVSASYLALEHWDAGHVLSHPSLHGPQGSRFRSSCLQEKHLTHWIRPWPLLTYIEKKNWSSLNLSICARWCNQQRLQLPSFPSTVWLWRSCDNKTTLYGSLWIILEGRMAKSFCIAVNSELLRSYFNHKTKFVNSVRKQNKTNYSLCN